MFKITSVLGVSLSVFALLVGCGQSNKQKTAQDQLNTINSRSPELNSLQNNLGKKGIHLDIPASANLTFAKDNQDPKEIADLLQKYINLGSHLVQIDDKNPNITWPLREIVRKKVQNADAYLKLFQNSNAQSTTSSVKSSVASAQANAKQAVQQAQQKSEEATLIAMRIHKTILQTNQALFIKKWAISLQLIGQETFQPSALMWMALDKADIAEARKDLIKLLNSNTSITKAMASLSAEQAAKEDNVQLKNTLQTAQERLQNHLSLISQALEEKAKMDASPSFDEIARCTYEGCEDAAEVRGEL